MSSDVNRVSNGRQSSESSDKTSNKTSLRSRSVSVGRSRGVDYELRCRYWGFLFDNLKLAVGEIYEYCETDQSIAECKEAILVLDNHRRDFLALINLINLNTNFEATPPPDRPNSVSWEVRKSSAKQMTLWNTFFTNRSKDITNDNSNRKTINNSNNDKLIEKDLNKSEEKENIEKKLPKSLSENKIEEKSETKEQTEDMKKSNEEMDKISDKTEISSKSGVKTTNSNPTVNSVIKCSKPLNPLARSFTSRLHSTAPNIAIKSSSSELNVNVSPQTEPKDIKANTSDDAKQGTKTVVIQNNNQNKCRMNDTNLKRKVVSTPDLSRINNSFNGKNNRKSTEDRKSEPKTCVSVMNKNFTKQTNSSRAKSVRNNEINNKIITKTQNNVLSTRNPNVKQINNNLNKINSNKTKRVVDADGWEVVGRGRQRFKQSPPKVFIIEDESVVKTTADGTVYAVTASSQTTDDWDSLCLPMCTSWNSQSDVELLRTPGRGLKMHEKLSSPSRKRNVSPTESIKKHEEKLAKAQEAREKLLEKKAQGFKDIVKKTEEMKAWKSEQQQQLKASVELKLQRAEEKRQQQLNRIVRKAHDEDSKVNEILFINSLEAQNKKYDILSKEKDREMRLQDLQDERLRKTGEKQAKESAAEERRRALEEERQQRILELQERRKLKDQKIEQQLQEKEKERQEMATQKALDRQSKLSAVNALLAQNIEELQKKIRIKHDESKRRHEENIEQIKQKALELSVRKSSIVGNDEAPVCEPYDTFKICQLCQVMIKSEVFLFGHLRGKKHNDAICEQNGGKMPTNKDLDNFNIKYITEAPNDSDTNSLQNCENERLKAVRKRSKKLKQRLVTKANRFEAIYEQKSSTNDSKAIQSNNKNKISKLIKDFKALSADTQITGQWPSNMTHSLDRILNEFDKLFRSDCPNDCLYFHSSNGTQLLTFMLTRILNGSKERPTSLTDRSNVKLCALYEVICERHLNVSEYVLQSNQIIIVLDILRHRINLFDTNLISTSGAVNFDPVMGALCRLLSTIFDSLYSHYSTLTDSSEDCMTFNNIIQDVISYIVSIGMIDKLSLLLSNTRGSIDDWPDLVQLLQNIISFFSSISKLMSLKVENRFGAKVIDDETQLMMTVQMTHVCGVVSLIYGVLLYSDASVRSETDIPAVVAKHTLELTLEAIRFLNYVSLLDLTYMQSILGSEGLSLQLRHICTYLLWYCSHNKCEELLNEVILLIGNFVVLNSENQTLIQSGQRPTVVQQLCSLPLEYFSDDTLSVILMPTLIACCFNNDQNRQVLEQEMSTQMLSSFIESTIVSLQLRAVDSLGLHSDSTLDQQRLTFAKRFPKNRWNEAKDYFESQNISNK